MFGQDEMYPTWLSIPTVSDHVPKLNIEVRPFDMVKYPTYGCTYLYGNELGLIWSLFKLTERFLLRGPDFLAPVRRKRKITIDELSYTLPRPPRFGECESSNNVAVHTPDCNSVSTIFVGQLLHELLHRGMYADLMHQRIKRITFTTFDGKEQQVWPNGPVRADILLA